MINTMILPYLVDKTISLSTRIPTTGEDVEVITEINEDINQTKSVLQVKRPRASPI